MTTLIRRDYKQFRELPDWVESPFAVIGAWATQAIKLEDYLQFGTYVVRAELPGLDPETDITVTVADGILTIHAERNEEKIDKLHSEFLYGSFTRQVMLPANADEDHIRAVYEQGVLEVEVSLKKEEPARPERNIPVRLRKHIDPT